MKHLGISGGGTKISGLYGAAEVILLDKKYSPEIISGISAGALLSVPLALGKFEIIKEKVLNFDLKTFFNVPPIKPNGKIRIWNAIKKIIGGKHYLGEQFNLEKTLSDVVNREDYEDYQNNDEYPICIVGSVDFYTGGRVYVNLKEKEISYEKFLKFVNASASIPVFTSGIRINEPFKDFEGNIIDDEVLLYDGGVRDHSPSSKILESNIFNIKESSTIFSRPDDYKVLPKDFIPKNILEILNRNIDISLVEVSKNDEYKENQVINEKNIVKHTTIYLPRVMDNFYDVDKDKLKQLYEKGRLLAQDWI
jgi:predicted acylesterase/phospholipase RssA